MKGVSNIHLCNRCRSCSELIQDEHYYFCCSEFQKYCKSCSIRKACQICKGNILKKKINDTHEYSIEINSDKKASEQQKLCYHCNMRIVNEISIFTHGECSKKICLKCVFQFYDDVWGILNANKNKIEFLCGCTVEKSLIVFDVIKKYCRCCFKKISRSMPAKAILDDESALDLICLINLNHGLKSKNEIIEHKYERILSLIKICIKCGEAINNVDKKLQTTKNGVSLCMPCNSRITQQEFKVIFQMKNEQLLNQRLKIDIKQKQPQRYLESAGKKRQASLNYKYTTKNQILCHICKQEIQHKNHLPSEKHSQIICKSCQNKETNQQILNTYTSENDTTNLIKKKYSIGIVVEKNGQDRKSFLKEVTKKSFTQKNNLKCQQKYFQKQLECSQKQQISKKQNLTIKNNNLGKTNLTNQNQKEVTIEFLNNQILFLKALNQQLFQENQKLKELQKKQNNYVSQQFNLRIDELKKQLKNSKNGVLNLLEPVLKQIDQKLKKLKTENAYLNEELQKKLDFYSESLMKMKTCDFVKENIEKMNTYTLRLRKRKRSLEKQVEQMKMIETKQKINKK